MAKSEASKAASRALAAGLPEDLLPLEVRMRAMFGGYMVYATVPDACPEDFSANPDAERGVAVINDGHLFLRRHVDPALLEGVAALAPMYPGGPDMWRVDPAHLEPVSDELRSLVLEAWRGAPKKKAPRSTRTAAAPRGAGANRR